METLASYASAIWCAVAIELVGLWTVLQHFVENCLLSGPLRKCLAKPLDDRPSDPERTTRTTRTTRTKVAIVTGANRGLGLAITETLVRRGVHTLLLCRNRSAAESAVNSLFDDPISRARLIQRCTIIQVDLSSFASVQKAVSDAVLVLMRMGTRLDYIVANAGILDPTTFRTGQDGYELQLQVNTLSHILLIHLLLKAGVVRDSPASRILSVSSFAHHGFTYLEEGESTRGDPLLTNPAAYHPKLAYARSKWYQILLMQSLSVTIEKTYGIRCTCTAVNPGALYTDMARAYCKGEFPESCRWISDPILEVLMGRFLRRTKTAASLVLAVLTANAADVNGRYMYARIFLGPTGQIGWRAYQQYRSKMDWNDVVKKISCHLPASRRDE